MYTSKISVFLQKLPLAQHQITLPQKSIFVPWWIVIYEWMTSKWSQIWTKKTNNNYTPVATNSHKPLKIRTAGRWTSPFWDCPNFQAGDITAFLRWIGSFFLRGVVLNITPVGAEKSWVWTSKPLFLMMWWLFPGERKLISQTPLLRNRFFQLRMANALASSSWRIWRSYMVPMVAWGHSWLRVTTLFLSQTSADQSPDQMLYTCPTQPVFNFPLRFILHQYWHTVVEATVKQLLNDLKAFCSMTSYFLSRLMFLDSWVVTVRFSSVWIRGCVTRPEQNKQENQPAFTV